MAQIRDWVANNRPNCVPPSLHRNFADLTAALADSPRAGDLYNIQGKQYWFDGTDFLPVGPQDRIEVPDVAFANPDNPTTAEAVVYVTANFPTYNPGTLIVYDGEGTYDNPDYVWVTDEAGVTIAIEKPAGSSPVAVIDIHDARENFAVHTGGYSSHVRTVGRTIVNYEWIVLDSGGGTLASITGAPDDDASGEANVNGGTYQHPHWEPFLTCDDVTFCLRVTDDAGEVSSQVCETIYDYGIVTLYFTVAGTATFNPTLIFSNAYVAEWDMGDGTTYTSNGGFAHTYAITNQSYQVTARVCLPTLTNLTINSAEIGGTLNTIFAEASIPAFPQLLQVSLRNNEIGGQIPDLSTAPALTILQLDGNNLSGSIGGTFPPTLSILNVSSNNLTGSFPSLLNNTALTALVIDENSFTGPIPDVTNSPLLETYVAHDNNFSDTFPDLTNNPALVTLDVSNNSLTGPVTDLSANVALEVLRIFRNDLTSLPDMTANVALIELTAEQNELGGPFPNIGSAVLEILNIANQNLAVSGGMTGLPDPNTWAATLQVYFTHVAGFGGEVVHTPVVSPTLRFWSVGGSSSVPGITPIGQIPNFDGCPVLENLRVTFGDLDYIAGSLDTNANLTTINIRENNLTSANTDDILCDMDASGAVNGTMDIRNLVAPLAPPTPVGDACRTNLVGNGWSIITD